MTKLEEIVARIKTGSVKNVVPFGYATLPAPPYVVVKEEPAPGLGYIRYRCIAHMAAGQVSPLWKYVTKDLYDLLHEYNFKAGNIAGPTIGTVYAVGYPLDSASQLIVGNDDATISQERTFYVTAIL